MKAQVIWAMIAGTIGSFTLLCGMATADKINDVRKDDIVIGCVLTSNGSTTESVARECRVPEYIVEAVYADYGWEEPDDVYGSND